MLPAPSKASNIAFIGAPGSGKTTLAQALVLPLKLDGKDSVFVPEPARVFLRRSGPYQHYLEDFPIFLETVNQEEEMQVHEVLIYDNASFTAAAYMQFHRPQNLNREERRKWEYCYRLLHNLARDRFARFDLICFVPSGRFRLVADPERPWNEEDALKLSKQMEAFLIANGVPYHTVESVGPNARVAEVLEVMRDRGLIDRIPPLTPDD